MTAKLAKDYKPTDKEKYMSKPQLDYFRHKLQKWREELLAESQETINNLKEENWREPDPTDRASLETEAGVELRTRNRYLKLIGKIDAALKRIDDGTYGFCEVTGEPIGLAVPNPEFGLVFNMGGMAVANYASVLQARRS